MIPLSWKTYKTFLREKQINFCVAISKNKGILSGTCSWAVSHPCPRTRSKKYTEQFKWLELFASISGQIVSVPVKPKNPLRTAEMTPEDNYGMIGRIINNGCRSEKLEKVQAEARRTTLEKKLSIREYLESFPVSFLFHRKNTLPILLLNKLTLGSCLALIKC